MDFVDIHLISPWTLTILQRIHLCQKNKIASPNDFLDMGI